MKKNRFKILVILSFLCYFIAHIAPVYDMPYEGPNYFQGIWMNLFGWLSIGYLSEYHIEFFIWCANPIYLITLGWMLMHIAGDTKYIPSRFNIIMYTLAAIVGLQYTLSRGIVTGEVVLSIK